MSLFNSKIGKIYVTHINIRESIILLLLKLVFLDIIVAALAIFYYIFISNEIVSGVLSPLISLFNLSTILFLVFLKIALGVYTVLLWINEYYEIWPNLIMHRSGLFFRKAEKHPFSQMRSVRVEQGFFGKIFGFGTIHLYNWYLKKNTSLYLIHNPIKYYHIIEDLLPKSEKEKEIFLDQQDLDE